MLNYYLTIVLAPLAAAIVAGLFGKQIGRAGAHWITILAVGSVLRIVDGGTEGDGLDGGRPRTSACTPGPSPTACAWRSASSSTG